MWYLTQHAVIALLFAIAVDVSGVSLTLVKTYEEPESETYPMWIIVSIAGIFSMLAVGTWNIQLLIYPFYIFLANLSVAGVKFVATNKKKA